MIEHMEVTTAECTKAREIAQLVLSNRNKIQDALWKHVNEADLSDDVRRALRWVISQSGDRIEVMFSGLENEEEPVAIYHTIEEGQALLRAAKIAID